MLPSPLLVQVTNGNDSKAGAHSSRVGFQAGPKDFALQSAACEKTGPAIKAQRLSTHISPQLPMDNPLNRDWGAGKIHQIGKVAPENPC